uniref:Cytochrome P450 n=1 Tax=Aureoumbra lagunensis TaxID=44058 RepID=A0A7S3JRS1_9STRA|mmetsp:Transcript_1436/g.2087  ORF Transcript_1436/g.2087 Transcript_1436/m.2087 type:complete len:606 (+) Transcript_1436:43-1860(+)
MDAFVLALGLVCTSRAFQPLVFPKGRNIIPVLAAEQERTALYDVAGPADVKGEGLPWWWDLVWSLPFTKAGEPGSALKLGDSMRIFKANIEQIYGDAPSPDGAPLAEGDISGLADGTLYLGLHEYARRFGPVYKLCFGPKSFIVISDHSCARHVLRDNSKGYDKGVLAEILEDIMGKGLIPADPETWKVRRRAIVPAFHKRWLERMVLMFAEKTEALCTQLLEEQQPSKHAIDMEERLGSLALDIIGSAVFNYEFESVKSASPVVAAAIDTLREAEHRSVTPAPYWKLPLASVLVPRQVRFQQNMALLNGELKKCINAALEDRDEAEIEQLEQRDYSTMENPSLLRFLVDARGEDTSSQQLRDDLITMLIAGHETTASALTWCLFELAQPQQAAFLADLREEIDQACPQRSAPNTLEQITQLELTRLCVAESLRLYPQPPLLIRRALDDDFLPDILLQDTDGNKHTQHTKIPRASDMFINIYSLHRSPRYWENPDTFDPLRFKRKFSNPDIPDWAGFDPNKWLGSSLYPNEIAADFAFLPFGGGSRKCVGDAFATFEATVALAAFVQRFDFDFASPTDSPDKVGTKTGATIHTANGLWMTVTPRK